MSGQDTVTIMAIPDMDTYTVADNLTLICTLDPPPTDTSVTVTYLWECSGCFADGLMTATISRVLTDMDNSTIDCTVTVDGNDTMTDMPFDLQVTEGIVIDNLTVKLIAQVLGVSNSVMVTNFTIVIVGQLRIVISHAYIYVTGFAKTILKGTICISRNTNLKY